MGLGSFFGPLFGPQISYTGTDGRTGRSETFNILGGPTAVLTPAWSSDDYRGALGLPGARRAATLLADLVGGLPWQAFRKGTGGSAVKVDPLPALLGRPNPPEDRVATLSALVLDLVMHGNAIAVYTAFDATGLPTAMVPVPAELVGIRREKGALWYDVGDKTFQSNEVLHVKGHSRPGSVRGMGVLEAHLHTLDLARDLDREARSVAHHGVPTGTLKVTNPDASEEDLRAVKAAWLAAQRERSIAVLNDTADFTPLAWSPADTQLLDARRFSLHELALIFGVPGWFLGVATDGMTYSNVGQEAVNLLKFSVGPILVRLEQALSGALPPGMWCRANVDGLLRADTLTRYQAHALGVTSGFLTVDDVRALEDLPPLTAAQRAALSPPAVAPPTVGQPGPAPAASAFAVGDRVAITVAPHMPGQVAGVVALVQGDAYGIQFDNMPTMIHKWYLGSELKAAPASTSKMKMGA